MTPAPAAARRCPSTAASRSATSSSSAANTPTSPELDALGPDGKPIRITMGSYGVGVSRAVAVIAEQSHDELGLVWPREVAPADVHIVGTGKDRQMEVALELAAELESRGLRVLVDDRAGSRRASSSRTPSCSACPPSWSSAVGSTRAWWSCATASRATRGRFRSPRPSTGSSPPARAPDRCAGEGRTSDSPPYRASGNGWFDGALRGCKPRCDEATCRIERLLGTTPGVRLDREWCRIQGARPGVQYLDVSGSRRGVPP